jgi:Tol biopolymer transport system component
MRYLVAVIGLAAALYGADPAQTLQKGIDLMESKGDVAGAITLFQDAARSTDRAVAARALLYLGRAQERQGKERARQTYERIAHEFGDQREIAAQARERLAALNGAGTKAALTVRQLWTGKDIGGSVPFEIAPTADGRSLLFVDWASGDIGIRDMASGEIKRIAIGRKAVGGSGLTDFAQFALYSPDQRQIAYTWHGPANGSFYDFRVISTQPGAKPRVLIQHPELIYFKPFAWSSDGKAILTLIWKNDGTTQIAWVAAADGSFKTLKSLEWRNPEIVSLSPSGRYIAYDAVERQDSTDRDIFILAADGSTETIAVKSPGIDHHPVWTPDGGLLIFTSNRSRNFGLYALTVQDGKPQGAARLLKPDVGRITLCGFVRSGELYYLQPTGEQNVYMASLDPATGLLRGVPAPLGSTYVGMNAMPALSPDGKNAVYVSPRGVQGSGAARGPSTLVVKSLETQAEKSFSTDVELVARPEWHPDGRSLLVAARDTQSPPGSIGFYKVDVESGRFTSIARARNGLRPNQVALSPDGETVYMPGWDRTSLYSVLALSLSTGQLKTLYQTKDQIGAVALSPDGRTLAVGAISTMLLMNTDGSVVRTVHDLGGVWASAIAWSSRGTHILFVHRSGTQGSESELWRVPLDGGDPSPTGIHGRSRRDIHSGPDGAITYTVGSPKQAELWALDNLLPMLKGAR